MITIKKLTIMKLWPLACFLLSSSLMADHSTRSFRDDSVETSIFYSYEANGSDYISGVGAGVTFKDPQSKLGFGFSTSISHAEVRATDGYLEDYDAWEGAMRIGYFSTIYAYAEAGIDLTEAIFHDFRHDHDRDSYYEDEDDIDAFVGFGLGINTGALKVEGFSRLREIDSAVWEAESEWFSGVQISLNF